MSLGTRPCTIADNGASTQAYLSGEVCPPSALPYEPNLRLTDAGPRVVDPYGECSWLIDRTPIYDFRDACDKHDYGYDLIRVRALPTQEQSTIDDRFLADMLASCRRRSSGSCAVVAINVRAAVRFGNPLPGQPVKTSCSWWERC